MKTRFIFALLLVSLTSLAQRSEFKLSENGLIYSDATMEKLKHSGKWVTQYHKYGEGIVEGYVPDLMMGTLFRLGNANENHYLGSVGRMGRSLSESANRLEMEVRMLEMISDISLDDYNRALAYYLFKSYNYYLPDQAVQARNSVALDAAVKTLPHYLTVNIDRE